MEGIQILLIIVVVALTMLLLIVGIQVLLIISGVKRVLRKVEAKIDAGDMIDREFVEEKVRGIGQFFKRFRQKR